MARATSSGVPPRFIGTDPLTRSTRFGLAATGVHLSVDEAWADCVHSNPFFRHFASKANRHRLDCAFRRRIVDVLARRSKPRRAGRDVDDCTAGAAMLRREAPDGLSRAQERSNDIGRQYPMQSRCAHRVEPHLCLQDAGVVHEPSQPAGSLVDRLEQTHDIRLDRNIGRDRKRRGSSRLDVCHHSRGSFSVLAIVDADGIACRSRQPRRGRADAPTRACDDDYLAHVHDRSLERVRLFKRDKGPRYMKASRLRDTRPEPVGGSSALVCWPRVAGFS